jgi:hypothetical protein
MLAGTSDKVRSENERSGLKTVLFADGKLVWGTTKKELKIN